MQNVFSVIIHSFDNYKNEISLESMWMNHRSLRNKVYGTNNKWSRKKYKETFNYFGYERNTEYICSTRQC